MNMKPFGCLPDGRQTHIYSIRCGNLEAAVTDFGATLVSLLVPDSQGNIADVVLGFDSAAEYAASDAFFGATVGRNANDLQTAGKSGVCYGNRSAVCLETQYYPDAVNHPHWPQPVVKAGERYLSETKYIFA